MDKTIVFFDIDGTLVDDEKQMLATTKQAIKDLQRNGVHIAIATGRPPFMFQEIRDELDIDSYIASMDNRLYVMERLFMKTHWRYKRYRNSMRMQLIGDIR